MIYIFFLILNFNIAVPNNIPLVIYVTIIILLFERLLLTFNISELLTTVRKSFIPFLLSNNA